MKMIDLTNETFGNLFVMYRSENQGHHIMWHCRCKCGKEIDVRGQHLRDGKIKSCGCLKHQSKYVDITNKRFGLLTAIKPLELNSKREQLWECKCDCGSLIIVRGVSLRNFHTLSCGCLKSKGEEKISQILNINNIKYEKEKTFSNCRFPNGKLAKFDFYIDKRYLIEFDGKQHFEIGGWNTEESLKSIQQRDQIKNQWCKDNNISLIRIPYWHLKDLCLEDLLPEKSNFLIFKK